MEKRIILAFAAILGIPALVGLFYGAVYTLASVNQTDAAAHKLASDAVTALGAFGLFALFVYGFAQGVKFVWQLNAEKRR